MKLRSLTVGAVHVFAIALLTACGDTRPPYFNEQPTYSDPDLQDKPGYFTREPVYDWNAPLRPAAADPKG